MTDKRDALELWAGVECTLNRVGEEYFDQLEFSGHKHRPEDLDLFAGLGIRAMRYPVLWESVAPNSLDEFDWEWADERMEGLRRLGIRPIVGLLHHGSGPRYTSLLDPEFPEKLAEYARRVAERYPWVTDFTPVNEPLTTARFSGLYGYWYPHESSNRAFVRALLNQVRGTQLAMQAIRQVIPNARLVQTEDLGKVFSTPTLAYQAEYENERRWLTLDLLANRLERDGMMYRYLVSAGIPEAELETVLTTPPGEMLIGINHYVTSERWLDERLERYPPEFHGGNGRHAYADIEVVRVCDEGPAGPAVLLLEAWERYGLPLAVTEVHLGSTREEQLRWLMEVWESARELRRSGVDLQAVTAWALLGSYNWNTLVTRDEGHYESGIYDRSGDLPRPTLLARALAHLGRGEPFDHPVLAQPGWWRREQRLIYPPAQRLQKPVTPALLHPYPPPGKTSPPLLITGAGGMLGQALARLCALRGLSCLLLDHSLLDITDPQAVARLLDAERPWAVINAAGYTLLDEAEENPDLCRRINVHGAATLARACAARDLPLLAFSSAQVFSEETSRPYTESSDPAPVNVYGLTKAEADQRILEIHPGALLVRPGAYFSPWHSRDFLGRLFAQLAAGKTVQAAEDQTLSPTYLPHLVNAALDLLLDGETGIWHLANRGEVSWVEFGRLAASTAGLDPALVQPRPSAELDYIAPRPRYSALASERGQLLPPLDHAVQDYCARVQPGAKVEKSR
jgi:dTDP-4-dehydrorhamnose reductase